MTASVTGATGAGDVLVSGLVLRCLAGWPPERRLKFASLTASLTVQQFGGSLTTPGWGDITDWWCCLRYRTIDGDLKTTRISRDYDFLEDLIPRHQVHNVRRAKATFASHSDLPDKRK